MHGLGSRLAVAIASRGQDIVGAALFFADTCFGHYHLCGTTSDGQRYKANTQLIVAGAEWARRRGCRWLHLGGGKAQDDSLYQFKSSFGKTTFVYSLVTLVANRARYRELVRLRDVHLPMRPRQEEVFPAYRA
jgi:lipid II:glycine glycyltransferase (peptidoglycan interpeptide bridge formation enzyme)